MYLTYWITTLFTISIISSHPLNEVSQKQEQRIKGGQNAEIAAYPWQISFGTVRNSSYYHSCGGSIIDRQWILTAAHCVKPFATPPLLYTVFAGIHDLSLPSDHEQQYYVQKVIQHEGYNPLHGNNDVALLKINGMFSYNEYVSPIPLARPDQGEFIEGNNITYCVTSGWGRLSATGSSPNILQVVEMPLVPLQICKDSYSRNSSEGFYAVTEDMLCTGHMKGDKSPCHGDSGGPLACLIDGKWTLTGVVSWGKDCGYPEYPAVYARVTYFYDWIQKNMGKL